VAALFLFHDPGVSFVSTRHPDGTAALDKALDVLDAVGRAPDGLAQVDLGAALGLPRTTLYRLLGTLTVRGLLRRDALRRVYRLGPKCFEYARASFAMPDLVAAAMGELRALRDMTGETTCLSMLDGREVVALERCEGAHGLRSNPSIGQRRPLHCTSQGKAILAAMPVPRRDAAVRDLPLPAHTPRTITDRRRLQADLRRSAALGWSIDDEESEPGLRCCGAAVLDADGEVRGAISVAGPAFRLSIERLERIGPEVAEAARRIGAQLSLAQPPAPAGEARVVAGDWAFEGAHPTWSARDAALYWADLRSSSIHVARAGHDAVVATLEAPIGAMLALPGGGVAVRSGGRWLGVTADGAPAHVAGLPQLHRAGAACVAPGGAAWACVPEGERWRVAECAADGRTAGGWRLAEPAGALAWDAAGQTLAIAAPDSGTVWIASRDGTTLRRLATIPQGSGRLGGIAIDGRGGVWCALRGGWSVVRLEVDGTVERIVALPVPSPVDVGIGGEAGDTLFVTTAREAGDGESLDAAPLSGRLFAVDGIAGG
jgi:DNA-binding IclR family transcriptional regulator/sugar lactone lactonase YvrE